MTFEDARRNLLKLRDNVSTPLRYVEFQRSLAAEIRNSENQKSEDAKRHRHLLRLLGDSVVWTLLDAHIIRELTRDHLRPANLTNQGEDFEFVLHVAGTFAEKGQFPIISDLTHLIGVGDIVSVGPQGLLVAECKNRLPPSRSANGRIARQERRGKHAAHYLTRGHAIDHDGRTWISIDANEPHTDVHKLQKCVAKARASKRGSGLVALGRHDFLLAVWQKGLSPDESLGNLPKRLNLRGWKTPVIGGFTEAIDKPSPFRANPYALPLDLETRMAVAEGDLIFLRFIDASLLTCQPKWPRKRKFAINIESESDQVGIRIAIDQQNYDVSNRFVEGIVWNFRPVRATRAALIEFSMKLIDMFSKEPEAGKPAAASPSIPTRSTFIYRGTEKGSADPEPVIVAQLGELADEFGIEIPSAALAANESGDGKEVYIPLVIKERGGRRIMGIATEDEVNNLPFPSYFRNSRRRTIDD